jgi:hypothetical protein
MIKYTPVVYYKPSTNNLVLSKAGAKVMDNRPRRGFVIRDVQNIICPDGNVVQIKNYMLPRILQGLTVCDGAFTDQLAWVYDEGERVWVLATKEQIDSELTQKTRMKLSDMLVGDKIEMADGSTAYCTSDKQFVAVCDWHGRVELHSGRLICVVDKERYDWHAKSNFTKHEGVLLSDKFKKDEVFILERGVNTEHIKPQVMCVNPSRPLNNQRWHHFGPNDFSVSDVEVTLRYEVLPFDAVTKQTIYTDANTEITTVPLPSWRQRGNGHGTQFRPGLYELEKAIDAHAKVTAYNIFETGAPHIQLTLPDGTKRYSDSFGSIQVITLSEHKTLQHRLGKLIDNTLVYEDEPVPWLAKDWKDIRPITDIVLLKVFLDPKQKTEFPEEPC